MGKVMYLLIFVVAIEAALFWFGGANYERTSLFSLLLNPLSPESNSLYSIIKVTIVAVAAVTFVAGLLVQRVDIGLYATITAIYITYIFSIANLWQFIYSNMSGYLDAAGAQMVASVIIIPILIPFIVSMSDYVRGRD